MGGVWGVDEKGRAVWHTGAWWAGHEYGLQEGGAAEAVGP